MISDVHNTKQICDNDDIMRSVEHFKKMLSVLCDYSCITSVSKQTGSASGGAAGADGLKHVHVC